MTRLTRPESDRRMRRATRGGDRSPTFGEGRSAVVVVVSTSAAAGETVDSAGPLLVGWLRERGYRVDDPHIVPDGARVGEALRHHLKERPRILVTTGGTGLGPDDWTPEETRAVLDKEATGIVQALVGFGLEKLPEAMMSRGTAGSAGDTFVVNLPGSVGGVKDGITVLDPILHHIQAQLEDGRQGEDPSAGASPGTHGPREQAAVDTPTVEMAMAPTEEMALVIKPAPASGEVPVAGGRLTDQPLDVAAAQERVWTPDAGAVAVFRGVVRNHDSGRDDVVSLEYSAHPNAPEVLDRVMAQAAVDFPGVRLWAEHRVGPLVVGDDALVVAAASAHRGEAFDACAQLVDRIKEQVPIWKRQDYRDGSHDWVGVE